MSGSHFQLYIWQMTVYENTDQTASGLRLDKCDYICVCGGRFYVCCVCDAYLKRLQFDDENKPWHISMDNFPAPHANLEQGRAPVWECVSVCVCVLLWVKPAAV